MGAEVRPNTGTRYCPLWWISSGKIVHPRPTLVPTLGFCRAVRYLRTVVPTALSTCTCMAPHRARSCITRKIWQQPAQPLLTLGLCKSFTSSPTGSMVLAMSRVFPGHAEGCGGQRPAFLSPENSSKVEGLGSCSFYRWGTSLGGGSAH